MLFRVCRILLKAVEFLLNYLLYIFKPDLFNGFQDVFYPGVFSFKCDAEYYREKVLEEVRGARLNFYLHYGRIHNSIPRQSENFPPRRISKAFEVDSGKSDYEKRIIHATSL